MYRHKYEDDMHISLHDCRADSLRCRDGVLSLGFSNGIWALPGHPLNRSGKAVRTDGARLDFTLPGGDAQAIAFYLFREAGDGKTVREEWEVDRLVHAVNNEGVRIEFLDEYKGYGARLYKGLAWFDVRPYHVECELVLRFESMACLWNELRCDRVW